MFFKPQLRQTHPNLFYAVLLKAGLNLAVGAMLLNGREDLLVPAAVLERPQGVPFEFWGACFTLVAVMILFGISGPISRCRWVKRGLIFGSYIGGIWMFGFWSQFLQDRLLLINAPLLWTFYTLNHIIWLREPSFNPVTSMIRNGSDR